MKIFAIIVTYNGEVWIRKCLTSLIQSSIPVTIIVIDNDSKDETKAIIKNEFKEVRLIESNSNLGFGQGNNIGLKLALKENADYVFLLNQDAWIENNTIEMLITAASQNPDYGVISPFHLNYSGTAIEEYFNDYVIGQYTSRYIHDLYFNRLKPIYSSGFIHAAAWLISSNTIKKIGGFDPLFFQCGEDNDYVQRLLFNEMKIGFVPNSILYHQGSNDGLINPDKNIPFKTNQSIIRFKTPNASFLGSILVFLKNSFDGITSATLYRNFKQLKVEFKVFWYNLKRINRISKSRKLQKKGMAYLNNET